MAHIAFLGTGMIGAGMVESMIRRGDTVAVWNRTASKAKALEALGATVAPTPEEAVASAERVHMALPDDAVVDALLARVSSRLRKAVIVVDHSTTLPARTKERLLESAERGIRFVHAPVFMSPQMCRDAAGLMLVSAAERDWEQVRPALEKMTGHVWYLGERPDLAAAYKLFGNSMLFVLAGGVADVLALAKATGVPPAEAIGLFTKFQVGNMITVRGQKMAAGDFSASFAMSMARKDMRLMLETAAGQPLTVLPAIAARMDAAIARGHGADDLGAIAADIIVR
jgi:3-hydroxyisobutyrate dehydrogenase